jgi:hypothetical protein
VHQSDIINLDGFRFLTVGQTVQFECSPAARSRRPKAIRVEKVEGPSLLEVQSATEVANKLVHGICVLANANPSKKDITNDLERLCENVDGTCLGNLSMLDLGKLINSLGKLSRPQYFASVYPLITDTAAHLVRRDMSGLTGRIIANIVWGMAKAGVQRPE